MVLSIYRRYAVNITRIALMGIVTGVNLWLTSMSYLFWEETQKIRAKDEFVRPSASIQEALTTISTKLKKLRETLPIKDDDRIPTALNGLRKIQPEQAIQSSRVNPIPSIRSMATQEPKVAADVSRPNLKSPISEDKRTTQVIFNRQKKDKRWGANAKKIIEDAVADPELSGSKILNTECKTTLCRAVFKHRNFEDSHQLQMLLPLNLADQFPRAIIHAPNPDQAILESIVYFVRSGYTPLE